jgi:spore coat polysaccharide biosynthesis protein SpsF (cytidylyltransferase family)/aryl-alcohol dehydrogenase-like predicted oxidoreductase
MSIPSPLVVVQARLSSTRLPAKALLPIAGLPSVVLCTLRAANSGLPVLLATSIEPSDDAIVRVAAEHGIRCHRGAHDDVLTRFATATDHLPAGSTIVRLTADNVLPDGNFVEDLIRQYQASGAGYLGTASPQDGLPYGMSGEVFSIEALRRAREHATSASDREHVTPWIRRTERAVRAKFASVRPYWSRLRCTMDTIEDYSALCAAFDDKEDPILRDWIALVERLADRSVCGKERRCPFRVHADGQVHSLLALGTVQLGVRYGVANEVGLPTDVEAARILSVAADAGVTSLDTARAYGGSESRIGEFLPTNCADRVHVVTKLDVLDDIPMDASPATLRSAVDASVFRSMHELRRRKIDVLLLHRWTHRHAWNGVVWERLAELKSLGVISKLGASVANLSEAICALEDPQIEHLQCPVNVLDHRWRSPEMMRAFASRPDIVVHARSVFLQGLLTLPASRWPRFPGVDTENVCCTLDDFANLFARESRTDLCLAYVLALPWVTGVVIGVDSAAQLLDNLRLVCNAPLTRAQVATIESRFTDLPESFLSPAAWKTDAH